MDRVEINGNRRSAGSLHAGLLTLRLVARAGEWRPDGDSAPGVVLPAFAEEGRAPQIPGPMIRVVAGTEVAVTVRNSLAEAPLTVHGLQDRAPGRSAADSIVLAPGESRTLHMRLEVAGTYYYWGTTMGRAIDWRTREDAQLTGAIVVDERGITPPADRVLVLGIWSDTAGRVLARRIKMLAVINGRSWPRTERLDYAVGDTVRWRIINATADSHPMHLHGFYFRVDSHGDGDADTVYALAERRAAVTDLMPPGSTMSLTWVPDRAGNWLFHCHLPDHFEARGSLGVARPYAAPGAGAQGMARMNHALEGMSGLVVGVRVHPVASSASAPANATTARPNRLIRLVVRAGIGGTDSSPVYEYAIADHGVVQPLDTAPHGAPPLVLVRGEPVAITVVNTLGVPTAVHWHGVELESYYDGVAGFSGSANQLSPVIAPGDSFVARFTPPRAGTFIYHTHIDEERQQPAGLAGALLVLEPNARFDAATDIPLVITSPRDGDQELRSVLVNGLSAPAPLELVASTTYRLRFINMTMRRPGGRVELYRDGSLIRWRDLARDGAALPASRQISRAAKEIVSIGQTLDVELTPEEPGTLQLQVRAGPFNTPGVVLATVPIHVRAAP